MARMSAIIAETEGRGVVRSAGAAGGTSVAVEVTGAVVITAGADSESGTVNGTGSSTRTGADALSVMAFDSQRTGALLHFRLGISAVLRLEQTHCPLEMLTVLGLEPTHFRLRILTVRRLGVR